ncbi:DUF3006 domain-containing protein [Clostridium sp. BL-8]|uniref:DUF3006 domain-containing protein n=1 Tax=Clostridium sp. BL-8 TaxID=349938 RepID=UPI00098C97C7|nr:DUF3006 domain-containing protein [Clostridium sp. BL-8]OOM76168.1 hypothetical protein CLOBL_37170 [Clostridium sp. BL-8]
MNERYIIDRIEDKFAIVEKENGDMYKISVNSIRGNFEEGDILINKDEYFEIDKSFTLNRKKEMNEIMKDMWKE